MGVNIYLIDGGSEFVIIDVGYLETFPDVIDLIRQMDFNLSTCKMVIATHADAVVSANPGCLLQLMSGLRRAGQRELPAFHMVELLDASIRGVSAEHLLSGSSSSRADS